MLTIKAEIKKGEQKLDGTFNVKLRFTLDRKVKRLSTSLFVRTSDLTSKGDFKKNTVIYKQIENLVLAYQTKCNAMQVDFNHYSLEDIFRMLEFEKKKEKEIDFIRFSQDWIANAPIKGALNYKTALNAFIRFLGQDKIDPRKITSAMIQSFKKFLEEEHKERVKYKRKVGKRPTSNRATSLYLMSIKRLFKEIKLAYNDLEYNLIVIPNDPFALIKIPRQEATRKRAIDSELIRKIAQLQDQSIQKGTAHTNRFNLAKDCFILSFCLIGMNSADLFHATDYAGGKLTYYRMKTKDRRLDEAKMMVVVPDYIMPIFNKYRDKSGRRVFNFYKDYADERAFNRAINIGLKQVGEVLNIEDLEFYAARHSWATIAVNDVMIDKYTVHAALNHVDETMKVTDIYIRRDFAIENKANAKVIKYVFG